ncbi:MAG: hypothetical protein ACK4WD_08955 [Flavobacteriales bacterium]
MRKIFSGILLTLFALSAYTQAGISNPYSRFGIGILDPAGSVNHFAIGGITAPILDVNAINLFNPASYANLSRTTLQLSGKGYTQDITNGNSSETFRAGQVSEIAFGFKKQGARWGIALGLVPYSTVGYNLTTPVVVNDSTSASYKYDGSGGINRLVIGFGRSFRLYKIPQYNTALTGTAKLNNENRVKELRDSLAVVKPRLSAGINLNYLFGTLRQESRVEFTSLNFFSTKNTTRTTVLDFTLDGGVQYFMPLKLKWDNRKLKSGVYLNLGANYTIGGDLKSKNEVLGEMYQLRSGRESTIDTTYFIPLETGTVTIPSRIAVGASILWTGQEGRTTALSFEFKNQDWSTFSSSFDRSLTSNELTAYTNIAIGLERTPRNTEAANNIFERTTYRIGVRNTNTYLNVRDQNIQQQAVSAGFSIPILSSRSSSRFNFGIEYGQGGTVSNGLLEEDFINVQIGFSLTPHFLNPWFVQRRYD